MSSVGNTQLGQGDPIDVDVDTIESTQSMADSTQDLGGWVLSTRGRLYDPNFKPPRKATAKKGNFTGAYRAPYPAVFRRCGSQSTRECVVGRRPTGMHWYGYDKGIIGSKPVAPLASPRNTLASRGSPQVLQHVPKLRPGPRHWLFEG